MIPEHETEVSPGFAEAAWEATGGSCTECGEPAVIVVFLRREANGMEVVHPRCEQHRDT